MGDDWTSKEKFTLACCVARSGDQNWVSVSRNMKIVAEACGESDKRPPDFFSQKNCAVRYNDFLGTALTSKRKSRSSSQESANIETPGEQIYRKLTFANIEELNETIKNERARFAKLKNDLLRIQSGELDDQIQQLWGAIQSGQATELEKLIPEEHPTVKDAQQAKIDEATKQSSSTTIATTPTSTSTPSRPQRQLKETEKFKSYIEQRQKHNAKYHHHSTQNTPTSPSISPSPTSLSVPQTTTPSLITGIATMVTSTPSTVGLTSTVHGPTPVQVQNMITKTDTTSSSNSSQGLLIPKTEQITPGPSTKQPISSPTTPARKNSDSKESTSFLSSLLASPANEIKAQVTKITEELKEPAAKRDIHHVTNEAYSAYRKAQAPEKNSGTAPVLSKLLEITSATISPNTTPKVSPISKVPPPIKSQNAPQSQQKEATIKQEPAEIITSPIKSIEPTPKQQSTTFILNSKDEPSVDKNKPIAETPKKSSIAVSEEKQPETPKNKAPAKEKVSSKDNKSKQKDKSQTIPSNTAKVDASILKEKLVSTVKGADQQKKAKETASKKEIIVVSEKPKENAIKAEEKIEKKKEKQKGAAVPEEKQPSMRGTKEKQTSVAGVTAEKQSSPTDGTEEKQPSAADGTAEKRPSAADITEEKQPSAADGTAEKQPSAADGTEEKQPSAADGTAEKQPSAAGGTEEKQSSATEKQPSAADGTAEKQSSATDGTEEKQPSATDGTEEKQSSATESTTEKPPSAIDGTAEKVAKIKPLKEPTDVSKTVPLTIDVGDGNTSKKEGLESETTLVEPPTKKRALDITETSESVETVVTPTTKTKKKGKGRSRGGRKKTLSGSMKIEIPSEESMEKVEELDLDASGDLDADDYLERKLKAPLTPSMCSSPASPALSTGSNYDSETAQQQRTWRKSIMLVWKAAASHKYANVFLHPVTDEEAPGYSSIIFRPMDLSLIKKNIETGVIHTTTEFQRDIMLMFQNALMYNRKEHDVYRMAQEMRDDVMEQIQSFISTQLMLQTSGDRDSKNLRTKPEVIGHTRQSSKSGVSFLSL